MNSSWCIVGVGEDFHRVLLDRGISYERAIELRYRLAECEVFREVLVEQYQPEVPGISATPASPPATDNVTQDLRSVLRREGADRI